MDAVPLTTPNVSGKPEVNLSAETVLLLREHMRMSVVEGMAQAMTQDAAERFWTVGLNVLQRNARNGAGDLVLGGLKTVARKAFWVGLFLISIWLLGGWSMVVTLWRAGLSKFVSN